MSWLEAWGIENQRQKYRDIKASLEDKDIDESEKKELIDSYYSECQEIQETTIAECDELKKEVQIYKDLREVDTKFLRVLQSLSKVGVDGQVWPTTFSWVLHLYKTNPFLEWFTVMELQNEFQSFKQQFSSLSQSQREDLQSQSWITGKWVDGVYGPNTFLALLRNSSSLSWTKQSNEVSKPWEVQEMPIPELSVVEAVPQSIDGMSLSERKKSLIDEAKALTPKVIWVLQRLSWLKGTEIDNSFGPNTATAIINAFSDVTSLKGLLEQSDIALLLDIRSSSSVLIKLLQRWLWVKPDGDFWVSWLEWVKEKYGSYIDFADLMKREWIPIEWDAVLYESIEGEERWKDIFEERYWVFSTQLESDLWLPPRVIQSVVWKESTYGVDLINGSGSKWLMALTENPFEDMRWDTAEGERVSSIKVLEYQALFRKINLDSLLALPIVWSETTKERIPTPIIASLKTIQDSSDISQIQDEITLLHSYLKWDSSYFDHEVNMVIGSVYLAFLYNNRTDNNIGQAMFHYNGNKKLNKNGVPEQVDYKRKTLAYLSWLHDWKIPKWIDSNEGFSRSEIRRSARWTGKTENVSVEDRASLVTLFWETQMNNIELAVAVLKFQKDNTMIPLDGKPWGATIKLIREKLWGQ